MASPSLAPFVLVPGSGHPALCAALARALEVEAAHVERGTFADGESRVWIAEDVRGSDVAVLQPTAPPVNERLMELLLLVDAARAAGARSVLAITPYLCYARQEQRHRSGEPRSARVVSLLLGAVGLDHLVALDLHAPALESALPMPVTHLRAEDVFLSRIRSLGLERPVIVAPDAGGLKRAQRFARALGCDLAAIAKDRPSADAAEALHVLGDVRGRACLLVADLACTGRTLASAAAALLAQGASAVHAAFTHAVMAPGALERLLAAPLGRLLTSDSVPVPSHPRLEVQGIAGLLARTVQALRDPSRQEAAHVPRP
jgi:ribose-phosphate pyrophosphokinase